MAGNPDVGYDDDQQTAAAPSVTESWDAVTDSRKRTSSLGAAQTSAFWGHETGPSRLKDRSAEMFDAVSTLLNRESESLKRFEAKMHQAMTRFTGAEYDNKLEFLKPQADQQAQSIRENTADSQFEALLHRIGLSIEDVIPPQRASSAAASNTSTTSSGDAGSASASTPPTSSAPSDY
mgnify:FL=1